MGCAARHATITDGVNYGLGLIEANNHVMDDMHPGGAFMGTLNDSASLATESDSIQTRQAIIVTTSDWYYMGVSRLVLSNGAADDLTTVVYGAAYTAWAVSWDMFNNANPDDDDYDQEIAVSEDLYSVGWYLLEIDDAWCTAVTDVHEMGCVDASDEVVPLWSQQWVSPPPQCSSPAHRTLTRWQTILPHCPSSIRRMASDRHKRLQIGLALCMGIVLTCTTCSNPFEGNGNGGGGGVRRAQILWFVAGSGGGRPAYDGTTAYFLAGTDEVLAIDAITGAVRWHATMGAAAGSTPIFGSAVCTVVAAIVACGDTDVVAFSRNDGSRMWRFHPAVGYYPGYYEIAALGSTLYTGSPSGTMYAIDANTGGTHWIASIGVLGVNTSVFSPIVDSDIVVAAYKRFSKVPTGGVVAIDVKSGQIRWQTDFPHPAADSGSGGLDAALWGNLVLASCDDGRIYAFDRTTGQVLWSLPGVGRAPPSYAIPNGLITHDTREIVINNNRLYASSLADWVIGYDLTTQTEVWRSSTTLGSTNTQPIATDGTWVYDVLAGGQVMAFAVADGKAAWSFTQDATAIFGTVTPAGDRVFVSGQKGFYALSK